MFFTVPSWRSFQKQLTDTGATMQLMQQMALQGFPWCTLSKPLRFCVSVCAVFMVLAYSIALFNFHNGRTVWQRALAVAPSSTTVSIAQLAMVLYFVSFVSSVAVVIVVFGGVWIVWFFAKLHEHEILC